MNEKVEIAERDLQKVLDQFSKWYAINALTINTKNTKTMVFGSRNKVKNSHKPLLHINNELLQVVSNYAYLGVNLDQTATSNTT